MNIALTVISIVFAALRIGGVKSQAYQAFAHLFVGGLFGAALGVAFGSPDGAKWQLILAVALSLIELVVFLVGFFKTWFKGLG